MNNPGKYRWFWKCSRKYLSVIFLFFFLSASIVQADWRETTSALISRNNFQEALSFLKENLDSLPDNEKPIATGLLAFIASKVEKKQEECRWLSEFFEIYGGFAHRYEFLDEHSFYSLQKYLSLWKDKYPLIFEMSLIEKKTTEQTSPPLESVVYMEISSPAYYKIFHQEEILKAGLFHKGFNTFTLSLKGFFQKPGVYEYSLELKSGEIIVTKKFSFKIDFDSRLAINNDTGLPEKTIEQKISFYIEDKLIVSSRKIHTSIKPFSIELPPADGLYKPFGPLKEEDPWMNSFSVDKAVSGLTSLLNDLINKKDEESYQLKKSRQIFINFTRTNQAGLIEKVQATLILNETGFKARFNTTS